MGAPQSGKTSLIESLSGIREEDEVTSVVGRGRSRTSSANSMRRRQFQQCGKDGSAAGEGKVVGNIHVTSWTPVQCQVENIIDQFDLIFGIYQEQDGGVGLVRYVSKIRNAFCMYYKLIHLLCRPFILS